MKRGLSKKTADWELKVKIPKLIELKKQERLAEIDLKYLDESGFFLSPYIPYGWQEKNQPIVLKSRQSQSLTVLGLINREQKLDYEIHSEKVTSKTVIDFLDKC